VVDNSDENILNEARKAVDKHSTILESMEAQLRICQLACESFANMLNTEDDEFETNGTNANQQLLLESAMKSTNLFSILIGISGIPAPQISGRFSSNLEYEWKLLLNRCFGALSNMFLLMDQEFIISFNLDAGHIWNHLYSVQNNDNSPETVTSVVGCLSALARASPPNSITINYDHIALMINHYLQSQSSEFQVDIIGILGALAQYPGNIEANKVKIIQHDIIDDWKLFDGTGFQFFS
jgi:hypothetical protein